MKTYALNIVAACILLIAGCKLDEPDFSNIGPGNGPAAGNYQPFTQGSFWKYNKTALGVGIGTEKHTLTGATETINNKKYYVVDIESTGTAITKTYYSNVNGSYTLRQTAAGITVEQNYLRDNYAINQSWTSTITDNGSVNGVPARVIGKIVEKDITKVVSGKTFTSTIHTQLDVQYNYGQGFTHAQTIDVYVAKGVGIIESDSDIGGIKTETLITDYSIK